MQQTLVYPGANANVNRYVMGMCLRVDGIFAKRFPNSTPKNYFVFLNFRTCEILNLALGEDFLLKFGPAEVNVRATDSDTQIMTSYVVASSPHIKREKQAVFYAKEPEESGLCQIIR